MFTDTTNRGQIGNSHWSDHELTRLFIPSLSLLFTYPIAPSLTCIVRAYSTHVWFFVSPKRETRTLSSHRQTHARVYKIHRRNTYACNEARIDESSSFSQHCIVLFRSFFLLSSLLFLLLLLLLSRLVFLHSEINFPSASTDAQSLMFLSLFSQVFFLLRASLTWLNVSCRHDMPKKGKRTVAKKVFFSW